jgi:hypothetical protein
MASLGGVAFQIMKASYHGFGYADRAAVVRLRGGDPLQPSHNEVVQSSGIGARVATLSAVVESAEDVASLEQLLFTDTSFEAGDEIAARDVTVTKAAAGIPIFLGGIPSAFTVELELRER